MAAILTAGDMLLRDIKDHPDDDAPRLIYADWLADEGQAERAEFIRAQVALAADRRARKTAKASRQAWIKGMLLFSQRQRHSEAAYELLSRWCVDWIGPFYHRSWISGVARPREDEAACDTHLAYFGEGCRLRFRRGFVESVRFPIQHWIDLGSSLCREHPVLRVEATHMEPTGYPAVASVKSYWRWFDAGHEDATRCDPDELPTRLWKVYCDVVAGWDEPSWEHPTLDAAFDALSATLLSIAKG